MVLEGNRWTEAGWKESSTRDLQVGEWVELCGNLEAMGRISGLLMSMTASFLLK